MKGTSKTSGKAKMQTLYDADGNEVKVYRIVEEESSAGENYEYSKAGEEWHSWAD